MKQARRVGQLMAMRSGSAFLFFSKFFYAFLCIYSLINVNLLCFHRVECCQTVDKLIVFAKPTFQKTRFPPRYEKKIEYLAF